MRVLLVDNLLYDDLGDGAVYDLQPHAGLVSLVAVARSGGHAAEVLDPKRELADGRLRLDASIVAALADQIIARRPDVVGFTALGCNFVLVIRTAAELKRLGVAAVFQPGASLEAIVNFIKGTVAV